jgi:DnaJ-class molecular chaperone
MKEGDYIVCPNCNGKGHVMDGGMATLQAMTIVLIPTLFFERNDRNGTSRCDCSRCDGKGVIKVGK